ncbi:hypothetical protein PspLS_10782 [Pyricularia sp. CBS 133598]|nr:hypothetical protein PspLS_10782 [Pyricularia sp. CBS 133598]
MEDLLSGGGRGSAIVTKKYNIMFDVMICGLSWCWRRTLSTAPVIGHGHAGPLVEAEKSPEDPTEKKDGMKLQSNKGQRALEDQDRAGSSDSRGTETSAGCSARGWGRRGSATRRPRGGGAGGGGASGDATRLGAVAVPVVAMGLAADRRGGRRRERTGAAAVVVVVMVMVVIMVMVVARGGGRAGGRRSGGHAGGGDGYGLSRNGGGARAVTVPVVVVRFATDGGGGGWRKLLGDADGDEAEDGDDLRDPHFGICL